MASSAFKIANLLQRKMQERHLSYIFIPYHSINDTIITSGLVRRLGNFHSEVLTKPANIMESHQLLASQVATQCNAQIRKASDQCHVLSHKLQNCSFQLEYDERIAQKTCRNLHIFNLTLFYPHIKYIHPCILYPYTYIFRTTISILK